MKTYIAVVIRAERCVLGYVLDCYPSEREAGLAELAKNEVVGEYAQLADAQQALALAMVPCGRMH
jgi:hypothetical protein